MTKIKRIVKQIEETVASKPKKKKKRKATSKDILSSGSTLLNLACTNNAFGAFQKVPGKQHPHHSGYLWLCPLGNTERNP